MRRREFIRFLAAGTAAWPVVARAQQAPDRPIVGVLSPTSSAAAARNADALRAGLRDLGYSEGRNIRLALRYADGAIERLADLAAELVALRPAVILSGSPAAALAVRAVTPSIPIVMNSSSDPVALGLASSISRPGGNVTGIWWGDETLVGKRLQLLKEVVPGAMRVGFMVHPDDPTSADEVKQVPIVSSALGLTLRVLEVHGPVDFDAAFAAATRENLQGLYVNSSPLFVSYRTELAARAARAGLPAIYSFREFTIGGGLMSYGASLSDIYRREAGFVDKILKGANPAELPIERPVVFELLINLATAKALGLNIPPSLLARADEVVE
jgi:putative tryptophan/tyrosine transport system substrate-binding protein